MDKSNSLDHNYFGKYLNQDSCFYNENCSNLVNQIVHDSGIQSDEEDKPKRASFQSPGKPKYQKIDTEGVKVKTAKPRAKLMRKNMESQLNAAKLKTPKEPTLKGKLKKNLGPTEKQLIKDMISTSKM